MIKTNNGNETETEYFGALVSIVILLVSIHVGECAKCVCLCYLLNFLQMTSLEASDDEKSAAAITYLLSLILPK